MHGGNSNADSEEMFREEFFEKEGSDYGDQNDVRMVNGEEVSVKFPVVRVSSQVGGAWNGNSRGGKESRCEGGYTNMEGNIVFMRKEGIESMSNDVPMQQDNTHKWGETVGRSVKEADLIDIWHLKAQKERKECV